MNKDSLKNDMNVLEDKKTDIMLEIDQLSYINDYIDEEINAIKANKENYIKKMSNKMYVLLTSIIIINPIIAYVISKYLNISSLPLGLLFGSVETLSIIACGILPAVIEEIYQIKYPSDISNLELLENKKKYNNEEIRKNNKLEKELDKEIDKIINHINRLDNEEIAIDDIKNNQEIQEETKKLIKKLK